MGLLSIIKIFTGCSNSSLFFKYGYNISDDKVYYKRTFPDPVIEMEGVDVASFKVMRREEDSMYADNTYYAVDKRSLYYKGYRVPGGDGPSFGLINVNYAKDNHQCYYRGSLIKGADPASFVVKSDNFSADKNHIFKRDMMVDNDASVFESFYDGYVVHTANTVCVYDAIVPVPQGSSFQHLGNAYFALNGQVYCQGTPLPDGNAEGFEVLSEFYSKTGKHVYYFSKLLPGADPATFKLLEAGYSRDSRHVFFFEKPVEGADATGFEIINTSGPCARDKKAVYYEDKKVTGFTAADLSNKAPCIKCDETAVYFAEKQ